MGRGSIAGANEVPLDGSISRQVWRTTADDPGREAVVREVTPDYFEVMRIRLMAGRPLDARDNTSPQARIVISESMAKLLGSETVVGRRIVSASIGPAEIAGVVADVKHQSLEEPVEPTVYVPAARSPSRS